MGDLFDAVRDMLPPFLRRDDATPAGKVHAIKPKDRPPDEWRERDVNRWLKEEFFSPVRQNDRKDWIRFIRYISIEFEEQNRVRMVVMTSAFIRVYIDAVLSDLWHDHRTSSISFALKSVTLLGVPLVPQFLSRWLTQLSLSIAGFIFNPVILRQGALLRFQADHIRLDLHHYLHSCRHPALTKYLRNETGDIHYQFVVFGAETYRGGIKPKVHMLSEAGRERCQYRGRGSVSPGSRIRFRLSDLWQISLVAGIAFLTVLVVRFYLAPGIPAFSASWSFLSSLLLLLVSLGIINLARWIYQFYWQAKRTSIVFRTEELRYRIDRIKRDIDLDMHRFRQEANDGEFENDLFLASLHRHKVLLLEEKLAVFNKELKIKFVLAYIITIISEYIAYRFF